MISKKIKIGMKVAVKWADAAGGQKIDRNEIDNATPKSLLVITNTYGILEKQDDAAILILQEDSPDQVDYTVIPRGMILEIKELK